MGFAETVRNIHMTGCRFFMHTLRVHFILPLMPIQEQEVKIENEE